MPFSFNDSLESLHVCYGVGFVLSLSLCGSWKQSYLGDGSNCKWKRIQNQPHGKIENMAVGVIGCKVFQVNGNDNFTKKKPKQTSYFSHILYQHL